MLVARRFWLTAAAVGGVVGPGSSAMAASSGEVRITAIAPADCRLTHAPVNGAASTHLACNTLSPATVTVSLEGLGGHVLTVDGKPVSAGPGERAVVSAAALARLPDWRLQDPGGAHAGGTVELTIVAD